MRYAICGLMDVTLLLSVIVLALLAAIGTTVVEAPAWLLLDTLFVVCMAAAYTIAGLLRWAEDEG